MGLGLGLDPQHHTEEPGQSHEGPEGWEQPVTCSSWCQSNCSGCGSKEDSQGGEKHIRRCVGMGQLCTAVLWHLGQEDIGDLGSGWLHFAGLVLKFPAGSLPHLQQVPVESCVLMQPWKDLGAAS